MVYILGLPDLILVLQLRWAVVEGGEVPYDFLNLGVLAFTIESRPILLVFILKSSLVVEALLGTVLNLRFVDILLQMYLDPILQDTLIYLCGHTGIYLQPIGVFFHDREAQNLRYAGPLSDIFDHACLVNFVEFGAVLVIRRELRRRLLRDSVLDLLLGPVESPSTGQHLEQNTSKRPHIRLLVVSLAPQQFR